MQKFNVFNVLQQSIKPLRFAVMMNKIRSRLFSYEGTLTKEQNLEWIKKNTTEVSTFANTISSSLWNESITQSGILKKC